jgi:lysophospholipase L1-like esterase
MSRFDRHPVASGILFAGVLLALGLAGAELTLAWLRDDGTAQSRFVTYDRQIHLREWRPNTWWQYATPKARLDTPGEIVRGSYRIETDDDGFIKPARVHADPDVTIVFLGGSTTECMYVDAENRFPFLAGRLLEQKTGLRVNSLNGGKAGNNITHINYALNAKVVPLRPDYVVLMEGVNDMALLQREGTYWVEWDTTFRHVTPHKLSLEGIGTDLRNLLIPRTYEAFRVAQQNVGFSLHGIKLAGDAHAAAPARPHVQPDAAQNLAAYRAAVTQFVATAKAWGIKPILMTQLLQGEPTAAGSLQDGRYLDPAALLAKGLTVQSAKLQHAAYNAVVREVARVEGVPLIDLDALVPADATMLYDGMHYHDTGSRRVAAVIADRLADEVSRRGITAP